MLGSIPLLIIPFILYNIGLTGVIGEAGGDPWTTELFSLRDDVRRHLHHDARRRADRDRA